MRKKKILARAMLFLGAVQGLRWVRTILNQDLPILAYHRIMDLDEKEGFSYDRALITASQREFTWQMEFVKRHYVPLTFGQVLNVMDDKARLPKRAIIVTFDDGFDDFFHVAYPVLHRLGVPATIFLSTGYINEKRTFWFDWAANIVLSSRGREIDIPELGVRVSPRADDEERDRGLRTLLHNIKRIPDRRRREILMELETQFGDMYSPDEVSRPLDWDQVKEMVANGIEVGSHTVSHPILTSLDDDALEHELCESRAVLEETCGREVRVLAYPNGGPRDFDDRVMAAARKAGYRIGVSYIQGVNHVDKMNRYDVRRLRPEPINDRDVFAATLALPEILS